MNTETQNKRGLAEAKEERVVIKLGLDVHGEQITICRQVGGCVPQPAQRMSWERALGWIQDDPLFEGCLVRAAGN